MIVLSFLYAYCNYSDKFNVSAKFILLKLLHAASAINMRCDPDQNQKLYIQIKLTYMHLLVYTCVPTRIGTQY